MATILQRLCLDRHDPLALRLRNRLARANVPPAWLDLVAALARTLVPADRAPPAPQDPWPRWDQVAAPLVLGVAGGQGSGKSTLARELERALNAAGARVAACSLDDFYLSHARRHALAAAVHPLLATRGVPGTHDVAALRQAIEALARPGTVSLPVFDKGTDDPLPTADWRRVEAPVDVLVLEGWCVGAPPQPAGELAAPVNALEAHEDADGVWRRYVNDALAGPYAGLWERLDALVFLQVPDLAAVRRWRTQQEQALPAERRMSGAGIERFVAHYERLTRWMLTTMPERAAVTAVLDGDHELADLRVDFRA
ncbi:MAG: hypothetical protein RIC56_11910 [Pseudomonadales bacterium]